MTKRNSCSRLSKRLRNTELHAQYDQGHHSAQLQGTLQFADGIPRIGQCAACVATYSDRKYDPAIKVNVSTDSHLREALLEGKGERK